MKKLLFMLTIAFSSISHASIRTASFSMPPEDCKVDHRCDLHGLHEIDILNDTGMIQNYSYQFETCVLREGTKTDCNYKNGNVTLFNGVHLFNRFETLSQPKFQLASGYTYQVRTQVASGSIPVIAEKQYQVKVTS